mgnify:CR=1 FL=1
MAMVAVVVALRQELYLFAPVPRVCGIVEDQYPVSSLHGEGEKEGVKKPLCEDQQETPPVDPEFREEAVGTCPCSRAGRSCAASPLPSIGDASKKIFLRKTRAKRNCRILRGGIPFPVLAERLKSQEMPKVRKNSAAEERVSS